MNGVAAADEPKQTRRMGHHEGSDLVPPPVRPWTYLFPLLAAAAACTMTLRWILQSPPWQAQPWALWVTGTAVLLLAAGGASAFVVAIAAVVAFEERRAHPHRRDRSGSDWAPRTSR